MPCTLFELPAEIKDGDKVKHLTPPERWKYFHKTTRQRNRMMAEQKAKEKSHLVERSSGGENFATSARLAMTQELFELNSFYERYGDATAKLGNHTIKDDDPMYCPPEYYCCVHTPVNNWRKIDDARKALDKEKAKLEERGAWDLNKARPRREVEEESRRIGEDYHFGKLMLLCHLKGSQLCEDLQSYKGRIVYCGNDTRDQDGDQAVFSAQGTQSSHLSAAKYVDAIARLPGNDGGDAEAS